MGLNFLRWPTRVNAIKNGLLQTKKIGCKQKRWDANKKDRMQTKNQNLSRCKQKRSDANKKIGCKQERSDANKKDRMQTKKIGCKQKR